MEKRKLVALIGKLYKGSKQAQSTVVSDGASQKNCGTSITKFSGLRKMKADVLNSGRFPHYSGHFPPQKSSKVGAFLPLPPPFCEKSSVSGHQKSRMGTNPIRPNDADPSLSLVRRAIIVANSPYSDAKFVQTCKNNHPSFVSKLGWLYVSAPI